MVDLPLFMGCSRRILGHVDREDVSSIALFLQDMRNDIKISIHVVAFVNSRTLIAGGEVVIRRCNKLNRTSLGFMNIIVQVQTLECNVTLILLDALSLASHFTKVVIDRRWIK